MRYQVLSGSIRHGFTPTPVQLRIAAKTGYLINGEDKWMLRTNLDQSSLSPADWIGPASATDCEMRLWAMLLDLFTLMRSTEGM